ncbi:MAG: hypothetical protein HY707_00305 [Ignavibacteriae bacterium]|nr:hypothetical protein [Ignavibacteriota bacterium]
MILSLLVVLTSRSLVAQVLPDTTPLRKPRIEIHGVVQFHWIIDGKSGKVPNNEFLLRRARFKVEPTITQKVSAMLEIDFGRSKITAKDLFVEYNVSKALKFTLGQQKMPFNREQLTSGTKILFIERTNVNDEFDERQWVGRDIGISAAGKLVRGKEIDISYHAGIFNGMQGSPEFNNAKQYAERIIIDVSKVLSVGVNSSQKTDSVTAKVLTAHGIDLSYEHRNCIVEAEVLYGNRTLNDRMLGGYGQVYYNASRLELGVRYENLLRDIHRSTYRQSVTTEVGYIIDDNVRLRLNVEGIRPQDGNSYLRLFTQVQAKF